jgi:cysteine sulfinate desulfinase/cysteine desulfurase-like protein
MQPYLDTRFGNPSSVHRYATAPAEALAAARGQVAALMGGDPAGIVFTGSGSESDNLAIRGFQECADGGDELVPGSASGTQRGAAGRSELVGASGSSGSV